MYFIRKFGNYKVNYNEKEKDQNFTCLGGLLSKKKIYPQRIQKDIH